MSGIAEVLINLGCKVSGSDLEESPTVEHLRSLGASIMIGHRPENVTDPQVVVISSAVSPDNPEIGAAREKLIPVIPRAEMLAELMRLKYGVAVAGTHGKTTTTSLIATVLSKGNLDPTIVIGGRVKSLGTGAKLGQGEFLVAEADESDGSFIKLTPTIAVVTTLDEEHLDHYGSLESIREVFLRFVNKVPFYGAAIVCLDEPEIQQLIPNIKKRLITYGSQSGSDYVAVNIQYDGFYSEFGVEHRGENLGRARIHLPGLHNVHNALAAVAVGRELEIPSETILSALEEFSGIHRRCEWVGEIQGAMILDDYGHHPVEIKASLRGIKMGFGHRRVIAVFQPHRYTRTRDLLDEFCTSFYDADVLIITKIYPAGEPPIDGVEAKKIWEGARTHGHRDASYIEDWEEILERLKSIVQPNDIILTLGAGDIYKIGQRLLDA